MGRLTLTFALALGCAASYGPAPLDPERPIAELSDDDRSRTGSGEFA
jgi:hypothetical protein